MMKRIWSLILCAALLLPLVGRGQAASATPTAHGIDVSHHQGQIDWDTVAKHIDFAILRVGYGMDLQAQDDRQWLANVQACTRLKIPFGVYIYSHATNEEQALSEAQHVLRLIKGYKLSMPVYLDLEDEDIENNCTPEEILRNATVFCNAIEEAGYEAGIYANTYWWGKYLTSSQYDKWDRWVARYASQTGYSKPYSMWQYTSEGSVPGIQGNVDMNYWYGTPPTADCTHNYIWEVTKEPTCTGLGRGTYTCTFCGDSYREYISSKGHSYEEKVIVPTCTEDGFTVYTCTACGDSYVSDSVDSIGHSYTTEVTAPTCTEGGFTTYTCATCGDSYKGASVAPTGHSFTDGICVTCGGEDLNFVPYNPFADVGEKDYFYAPVLWAVNEKITTGMSATIFAPEAPCTRGQIVTFLWRAYGCPEPMRLENPFEDVSLGAYYYKAVLWAVEQGITTGMSETSFAPDTTCTRGQVATFLWRAQGKPLPSETLSIFSDVSPKAYYYDAVLWAVEQGITQGTGKGKFSPETDCTRGQIVTFLYRAMS